jgi:signal transduction histidine kinase
MTIKQIAPSKGNILVVDDTPANLRFLNGMLLESGYRVRLAPNGKLALKSVHLNAPDLILLDIMMPEMSGYELCRQLKADETTHDIPVIFISALDDVLDKVTAFSAGGVDYITKPFQAEEVLARVKTHLTIRHLQQTLEEQIAELDAFAHTVAHDLKNPLSLISTYQDLLIGQNSAVSAEDRLLIFHNVRQSARKAINIINELLLLTTVRKQDVKLAPLNMAQIMAEVQHRLSFMIEEHQAQIILPEQWPAVAGYGPWIEEVWANYISNGIKYGGTPPRLEAGATPHTGGMTRFWMRDNGRGLSAADRALLFTEFKRLEQIRVEGHGLGLSIVRRIIDKLGGQVGVESDVGAGSTFYFTLPNIT